MEKKVVERIEEACRTLRFQPVTSMEFNRALKEKTGCSDLWWEMISEKALEKRNYEGLGTIVLSERTLVLVFGSVYTPAETMRVKMRILRFSPVGVAEWFILAAQPIH